MTDYAYGSSAILGRRNDLGSVADRYMEERGLGPESTHVALKLAAKKIVTANGSIDFLGKTYYDTDDMSNSDGQRFSGGGVEQAQAGEQTVLNVTMRDFGKAVKWDILQPSFMSLMEQGGGALVESTNTSKSVVKTLEALDYHLAQLTNAGTDPWTASEVDCTGTPWSGATNQAVTQLNQAFLNYDGFLNSVLLSVKASNYLRNCSDVVSGYGGNTGAGVPLDPTRMLNFWGSFGISKIYLGNTAVFGSTVTLFRGGGPASNPEVEPNAIIRCHMPRQGENANGMRVLIKEEDYETAWGVYTPTTDHIKLIPPLGVRLINTYA